MSIGNRRIGSAHSLASGIWPLTNAQGVSVDNFIVAVQHSVATSAAGVSVDNFGVAVQHSVATSAAGVSVDYFGYSIVSTSLPGVSVDNFGVAVTHTASTTLAPAGVSVDNFSVAVRHEIATDSPGVSVDFFSVEVYGVTRAHNVILDTSDVFPFVQVKLIDPNNTVWTCDQASYTQRANGGHQWGVTIPGLMSWSYDPEGKWTMVVTTRKGVWTSPPLAILMVDLNDGPKTQTTTLAGSDFTSWRLGTEGFSSPSFQDQTTQTILNFIAIIAQTTAYFEGAPFQYSIEDYTIHSGSLMSHVARICFDFAWQFRIGPMGELRFYPISYTEQPNRLYLSNSYNQKINPAAAIKYLRLVKHSKGGGIAEGLAHQVGQAPDITLPEPWNPGSIQVQQDPINGSVVYAVALDAMGAVCQFFRFSPLVPYQAPTSTLPAVTIRWFVQPPTGPTVTLPILVRLLAFGRGVGIAALYDSVFEMNYPAQIPYFAPLILGANYITYNLNSAPPAPLTGASINYIINNSVVNGAAPLVLREAPPYRLKIATVSSSLWPTITSMSGIVAGLWTQAMRDYNPWQDKLSEIDPFMQPGELRLSDNRRIAAPIQETSWVSGPESSHTLSGYNPVPAPGGAELITIGQQV